MTWSEEALLWTGIAEGAGTMRIVLLQWPNIQVMDHPQAVGMLMAGHIRESALGMGNIDDVVADIGSIVSMPIHP